MHESNSVPPTLSPETWDVVVIGGALAGSSAAWLLKQNNPELRILVIEKSTAFKRRVGEATVEVSSYFLTRVLGVQEHLMKEHVIKQGLRFWFSDTETKGWDDASEIGPGYNVRLSSFQVDRAKLDSYLLDRCLEQGIVIWRPARVKDVTLKDGGEQALEVERDSGVITVRSRWVIDASGVATLLARKNDWKVINTAHPTAAAWCRWSGVPSWDCPKLHAAAPAYAKRCYGVRNTATNHLMGDGWWSWWIPLHNGDVSIGVVWDERIAQFPAGDSIADRLRTHLATHPLSHRLLAEAEPVAQDSHIRRPLAYHSKRTLGDGFALVGDAAAFLDPFYSPGMDWVSFSVMMAVDVIGKERAGRSYRPELDRYAKQHQVSYQRWFDGIYRDKYYYMGDFVLMHIAFQLDFGTYNWGVASQPYKWGPSALLNAPLAGPHTAIPAYLLKTYNRRLVRIARQRKQAGTFGRHNHGRAAMLESYKFDLSLPRRVFRNFARWGGLEVREGWRSWGGETPAASAS